MSIDAIMLNAPHPKRLSELHPELGGPNDFEFLVQRKPISAYTATTKHRLMLTANHRTPLNEETEFSYDHTLPCTDSIFRNSRILLGSEVF